MIVSTLAEVHFQNLNEAAKKYNTFKLYLSKYDTSNFYVSEKITPEQAAKDLGEDLISYLETYSDTARSSVYRLVQETDLAVSYSGDSRISDNLCLRIKSNDFDPNLYARVLSSFIASEPDDTMWKVFYVETPDDEAYISSGFNCTRGSVLVITKKWAKAFDIGTLLENVDLEGLVGTV